jgi:hypothetical protein
LEISVAQPDPAANKCKASKATTGFRIPETPGSVGGIMDCSGHYGKRKMKITMAAAGERPTPL